MKNDEEPKKKLRLSVSAMKTYESCRRKYYYQYIEKLPRKDDWEHLKVGNFVHEVLELFHDKIKVSNIDVPGWKPLISELCKEKHKKFQLNVEQAGIARDMLKQYLAGLEEEGLPNVVSTEKKFSITLDGDVLMVGVIDRVDNTGPDQFHLIDYKTGKSKYLDEVQLLVYALSMFREFPHLDNFKASYLCLAENCKLISYNFSKTDALRVEQKIKKVAEEIRTDQTWDASPSPLCAYCDFTNVCTAVPDKFRPKDDLLKISNARREWV